MSDLRQPDYRRLMRVSGWLCCIAVLVAGEGCGYRLRGSSASIAPMPATVIEGLKADSPLMLELQRLLRGSGTPVVGETDQAKARLIIRNEAHDRRVLSVGGTGKVREYELHYEIRFEVRDVTGNIRLPPQSVSVKRDFAFDGTDVLAKELEQQLLFKDLRHEASGALLQRVQAIQW